MLNGSKRKAAVALVALGPERAADVLRGLPEETVLELIQEVGRIGRLDPNEAKQVLVELAAELRGGGGSTVEGGPEYMRRVLDGAYGDSRAEQLVRKLGAGPVNPSMFWFLERSPAEDVSRVLQREPPSVIALVLAYLDAEVAAGVFASFDEQIQTEVALRLGQLAVVHRSVIDEVAADLEQRLAPLLQQPVVDIEGMDVLVQVLNNGPQDAERRLLGDLAARDAELASELKEALFVFDDLVRLSDRAIQELLKSSDSRVMATALKDADAGVSDRIFKNLSERARDNLREEIEYLTGIRPDEIKAARKEIVAVIRQLEEAGTITIDRGGSL